MPIFNDNLQDHAIDGSAYGFSATRIENLGAAEYTLVALVADASGSVIPFKNEIEECMREIARSCRRSPRADNLLLRVTTFDTRLEEVHGFQELASCAPDAYRNVIAAGGGTALYDAAHNAVESVTRYGGELFEGDFDANAIVFVVTDGEDNSSTLAAHDVRKAVERALATEALDSISTVLVGVDVLDRATSQALAAFRKEAGFDAYVELGAANESTLAQLANFVSSSVAAQSQALGTGASASLSF